MLKNFIVQYTGYLQGFYNAFLGFRPIHCTPSQAGVHSLERLHLATV